MSQDDLSRYRSFFPYLESGTMYFDHAAIGPLPKVTADAVQSYAKRRSETELNVFLDFLKTHTETKERIGKLINASKERIALCDNTSNALNVLAAGLEWKTGDRILLTDMEFPANVYPFLNQQKHGVEVDFIRNRAGRITVDDVDGALTPKTRLLSISHVQFLHGFRADLKAIGELCKKRGVIFCVDAIQSAGVIPIDVQAMGIDFLASGVQKWLLSPEGTAFLFVSEETQQRISQGTMGWMSIKDFFTDFFRYRLDYDPTARRYENGTMSFVGVMGLHASLGLLLEVGIERIERHVTGLSQFVLERIRETGTELLTPPEPSSLSGIVSFRPRKAQEMFDRLKARKIVVSIREQSIRFSPHFYNTREELAAALDAAFSD